MSRIFTPRNVDACAMAMERSEKKENTQKGDVFRMFFENCE